MILEVLPSLIANSQDVSSLVPCSQTNRQDTGGCMAIIIGQSWSQVFQWLCTWAHHQWQLVLEEVQYGLGSCSGCLALTWRHGRLDGPLACCQANTVWLKVYLLDQLLQMGQGIFQQTSSRVWLCRRTEPWWRQKNQEGIQSGGIGIGQLRPGTETGWACLIWSFKVECSSSKSTMNLQAWEVVESCLEWTVILGW